MGGGVGGVGGGLMTSMRMRLVFSFCFLHLLVLFGGAVRSWGGGGGGGGGLMTSMRMRLVFVLMLDLVGCSSASSTEAM